MLGELELRGEKLSSAALARNLSQLCPDPERSGLLRRVGTRGVAIRSSNFPIIYGRSSFGKDYQIAIIGAGRIGSAIADYYGFSQKNFTVAALFDSDPKKIEKK